MPPALVLVFHRKTSWQPALTVLTVRTALTMVGSVLDLRAYPHRPGPARPSRVKNISIPSMRRTSAHDAAGQRGRRDTQRSEAIPAQPPRNYLLVSGRAHPRARRASRRGCTVFEAIISSRSSRGSAPAPVRQPLAIHKLTRLESSFSFFLCHPKT
jgi:hypothetical protein